MNKLPTKQIYLLTIIIVGIISLSVYSTYALFTFESETSDIVSIHTPKSLQISENIYEYQQLVIEPNTVTTTDIDIYNSFEYDVCYSIWYKTLGDIETENKVQIFEQSTSLTSSGVLSASSNIRVKLVIINDNQEEIKINIGTIGSQKQIDSCSLNIADDKSVISSYHENIEILSNKILLDKENITETEENYLTYKDIQEEFTYDEDDKIYLSETFEYQNELFTLTNEEELTIKELLEKKYLESKNIYFCKEGKTCNILYKITDIETEEIEIEPIEENQEKQTIYIYHITKYDKLIGYSKGNNGLRKINDHDYVYYGDNPNNFIYYNCQNQDDLSTCELWRIVGFFYNEETEKYSTKIVKNDSIGAYQYDYELINNENKSTNIWNESNLYKYLNEEYQLLNNNNIYLEEYLEYVERIPSLETDIKSIKIENEKINSKIKLLNLSDYLYTSICEKEKITEYTKECLTNNWLNNIEIKKEWTLTSKEVVIEPEIEEETIINENEDIENSDEIEQDEINEETPVALKKEVINYVYSIGQNIEETNVNELLEVRPVVYLKPRIILLKGNGSLETPYVVK